jgi:multiple sugar transport system substrate-binding protein
MPRLITRLIYGLLAAIFIASLAGCAPAAKGPVTVKVLSMEQAGPTVDEMNAIVTEFNKTNPNVKVTIDYVSYDALHDKISTAMAANPPSYDVFLTDDIWYAEFAKNGWALDVTSRVTPDMKSNIFPSAWPITTVSGKTYGMPWLLDEKYFYYNADLLKQAGFDNPPATWEELISQAKVIKQKGLSDYPIVWSWGQAEAAVCDWVTLLYGNGGTFMDDQGKPTFNNDKGVATLTWMVNTINDGLTNPASVSDVEEDARNVFSQGKTAFTTNWVYMYDLANLSDKESKVTGKVKMAPMPVFKDSGAKGATINGSMGFSLAAKSPNADAAWEYVKYLTSEPVQMKYSAHLLPIWATSFQGDKLKTLQAAQPSNVVTVPMFSAQFPFAVVRPKVPYYVEGSKALQLAMQQALTKQKTPKEALDAAAATWTTLGSK